MLIIVILESHISIFKEISEEKKRVTMPIEKKRNVYVNTEYNA